MDKLSKLRSIFQTIGIPYAYMVHRTKPDLPFFTYFNRGTDNFEADNRVYLEDEPYSIQLLSTKKEFSIERQLKDLLNEYQIPWEQDPDYYQESDQVFISQINI